VPGADPRLDDLARARLLDLRQRSGGTRGGHERRGDGYEEESAAQGDLNLAETPENPYGFARI
jgi:hypothetical protein